jgi:hypothetical protein
MRRYVDRQKLDEFMLQLGRRATTPGTIYITGGSTALLLGIRDQTIDIDIKLDPEPDGVFEAISELKIALSVNVELASPDQFIPALPGWRERSQYIAHVGKIDFRHYDFYAQALSKIERGYQQDLDDARALIDLDLIDKLELKRLLDAIRPHLIRYPAIDPDAFEHKLQEFLQKEFDDKAP